MQCRVDALSGGVHGDAYDLIESYRICVGGFDAVDDEPIVLAHDEAILKVD